MLIIELMCIPHALIRLVRTHMDMCIGVCWILLHAAVQSDHGRDWWIRGLCQFFTTSPLRYRLLGGPLQHAPSPSLCLGHLRKSFQHSWTENWSPTLQPPPPEQDAPSATVTLPYIRHLSETIRRILAPLRIRTSFRPHHTEADIGQVEGPKHLYNNEPVSSTESCVAPVQRCTLAKHVGRWNIAWRSTGGRWQRETQPSQR